jgi:hypothetical protein
MRRSSKGVARALALVVLIGGFYALTFDFRPSTDSTLNSLQTRSLTLHGDIDLARYGQLAGFVERRGPHVYSVYGAGISLVGAPMYLVATHAGASDRVLQALASIPFVTGASVVMYYLLLRLFDRRLAIGGTIVFAFGTTMWPIAATAFWQQGPVAFLSVLGLSALFSERKSAPVWAGLTIGLATFVRPTLSVLAASVALYYCVRGWRDAVRYVAGGLPAVAGFLIQGRWIWGSWVKAGYSFAGVGFHGNVPHALYGELFGVWRGLFVYSPVLILAVVGAFAVHKDASHQRAFRFLAISALGSIVLYAWFSTWWGGKQEFGYRYLLDIAPILVLLAANAAHRYRKMMTVAVPLAFVSILTMAFGAAPNRYGWDFNPFTTKFLDAPIGQAWIAFFDHPGPSLARLGGIVIVSVALLAVAPTFGANESRSARAVVEGDAELT